MDECGLFVLAGFPVQQSCCCSAWWDGIGIHSVVGHNHAQTAGGLWRMATLTRNSDWHNDGINVLLLLKPAQEPNNGVPGDWVTGSRMLDVAVLPLLFAVAFPLLRAVLKKHIYQVIDTTGPLRKSTAVSCSFLSADSADGQPGM
jgi:hypothetical protein